MTCEFCNKTFSTKSNLVKHQTKTKKCLKMQNKEPEIIHACAYCKKEFFSKDNYNSHMVRHALDPLFQSEERNRIQKEKHDNEIEVLKLECETRISEIEGKAKTECDMCHQKIKFQEERHYNEIETLKVKYENKILEIERENNIMKVKYENKILEIEREHFSRNAETKSEEQNPTSIVHCLKSVENAEVAIDQNNLLQIAAEMISAGEVNTTLEFVSSFMFALDSKEKFPINIELLVERRVFDQKAHAKRLLVKYFTKDVDYQISKQNNRSHEFVSETENGKQDEYKAEVAALQCRRAGKMQIQQDEIISESKSENRGDLIIGVPALLDMKAGKTHKDKIISESKSENRNVLNDGVPSVPFVSSVPPKVRNDGRGLGGAGGNKETIMLTTECFKSLSQTAMNEVGRQTRLYYQDMEKILKKYILVEYNNRINYQNSELKRISRNHNAILKKRTYFQFKTGPCMYLLSFLGKHKFGFSDNMNKVLPSERRMEPTLRVEFLVYSPDAYRLEQTMLLKYAKNLETPNHEIVLHLDTKTLIYNIRRIIDVLNLEHQEEDKVSEYNDQI
jgi:hypothetical protein